MNDKPVSLESQPIELFSGDKTKVGVARFVEAVHISVRRIFGDDAELYDDCLVNLAIHTLGLYCSQFKKSEEVSESMIEEITRLLPGIIESKACLYEKDTRH